MDTKVNLHQNQALLHSDFNKMQSYAETAFDSFVKEAVGSGSWYSRLTTTRTDTWEVTTDIGALYIDGARYRLLASNIEDLWNYRPLVHKKIVAVVGSHHLRNSAPETREVAINAEGTEWEPQPLSMAIERYAKIELIDGLELAVPKAPNISNGAVLIALVYLGTGGIEDVVMSETTLLPQSLQIRIALEEIKSFQATVGQSLDTFRTDLASINAQLGGFVSLSAFRGVLADINEVKADAAKALDLAQKDNFLLQSIDNFVSEGSSDTDYAGYAARIDKGLRNPFDPGGENESALEMVNPFDDKLIVVNNFALPKHRDIPRLSTWSNDFTAESLNAYTNVTIEKLVGRRPVMETAVGSEYTVRINHKFEGENITVPSSVVHNGIVHYLVDNEIQNQNGMPNVGEQAESVAVYQAMTRRVSHHEEYSYDQVDTEEFTSQGRAQIWLQPQAGWLKGVDLYIDEIGAANDVRVMIAEARDGDPDVRRIVAETTVPYAELQAAGATADDHMRVMLDPTLLKAGSRYAVMVLSQGNHTIRVSTDKQSVAQGDFFHLASDGSWQKSSTPQQMQMRLVFAGSFETRVAVDMEPLELVGGINSVNIFTEVVQPAATRLDYEVQIGGVWYVLGNEVGARLTADMTQAGNYLPLRVVFIGTSDLMPGIGITATKSAIKTSRAATTINHISDVEDLGVGSNAETVRMRVRAENWDGAKHAMTLSLINSSDVEIAADATEVITRDHDTVEYVATFNLTPQLQSFRYKITATTSDIEDQCYIAKRQSNIYASAS